MNIVTTYNFIYNAALMVEEGMGYALCLDKLIDTTGSSDLCFKPLIPRLEANLDIIWKKYQIFSRATEKVLGRLKRELLLYDSKTDNTFYYNMNAFLKNKIENTNII